MDRSPVFFLGGRAWRWPPGTRHVLRDGTVLNAKLRRWRVWAAALSAPPIRRLGVSRRRRVGSWPLAECRMARLFLHTLLHEIENKVCVGGTMLMPAAWWRHSHIWRLLLTCSDALVFDASRLKLKRYLYLACACRATHFAVAISWRQLAQKAQEQVRDAGDPVFCGMLERVGVISAKRVRAHMSPELSSGPSRCAASAIADSDL